ncbi:MAG: SpoIID/LytB domain-containing protein [Christensenellales bacterium]
MRKRIVSFLLCLLTTLAAVFAVSGFALAGGKDFSVIRVLLSVPADCTQVKFFVDGNYSVNDVPLARDLYTAKIKSGKAELFRAKETTPVVSAASVKLVQHAPTEGRNNFIWHNNSRNGWCAYLGDMQIRCNSGKIQLINHIYIEEYLYGVVPHEMSDSFPLEALKAQAICARTYAISKMSSASSSALYDINDTSSNQVYKGFTPSYTNANRAVEETKGMVLKCEYEKSGKIVNEYVEGFYAASNGGWTDIPQHSWTASAPLKPYHIIKPDEWDVVNPSSLQNLIVFPKIITPENKIEYSGGTYGNMTVPADAAERRAKIEKLLKVSAFPGISAKDLPKISILGFEGFVTHTHDTSGSQKHGGSGSYDGCDYNGENKCPDFTMANITMTVLDTRKEACEPESVTFDINMHALQTKDGEYCVFSSTNLRLLTVEETDTEFRLYRRRYGHGIGLSQRGAQQRAKAAASGGGGQTFDQILLFYFEGTHIFDESSITAPVLTPIFESDIMLGDVNGDETIDISDYTSVRLHILELKTLAGESLDKADVNRDGNIDITDYTRIRLHILGLKPINNGVPYAPTNATAYGSRFINIRSSANASSDSNIIGSLPDCARIQVTQKNAVSGWHKVSYGGTTAYMSASYLRLD